MFSRRIFCIGLGLFSVNQFMAPAMAQGFDLKKLQNSLPGTAGKSSSLSNSDISSGLREALKVASERTVSQVGKAGGYLNDSAIRIPLPGMLEKGKGMLQGIGAGGLVSDLETRMNRAAEAAAPKARDIFVKAITDMSLQDAQGILNGPQDAATQYFKRTTTQPLNTAMRPVVQSSMNDAGVMQAYKAVSDKLGGASSGLSALGGLGGGNASQAFDITDYVLEKAMDGLFYYIGKEEAAIRSNPAARSTDLLKKVFGS
ncbi:DUF4197 domain-containing protein [Ferrovibrio sp.]|uniref:DUF4197 domain-containing protein n=1 Tax=Ferrovibrio sp. TaxID=1917215 RepID=UPI0025B950CB|nr:DUF4197 domain-containing protein [Ferrovibrio sp.]MBX3455345.1 DUF4197 domain-containing protein [Ferrovibrio sp.]